jgi:hypothetical protein
MRVKPVIFLPEAIGFLVHRFDVPKQMNIQGVISVSSLNLSTYPFWFSLPGCMRFISTSSTSQKLTKTLGNELLAVVCPYSHWFIAYYLLNFWQLAPPRSLLRMARNPKSLIRKYSFLFKDLTSELIVLQLSTPYLIRLPMRK